MVSSVQHCAINVSTQSVSLGMNSLQMFRACTERFVYRGENVARRDQMGLRRHEHLLRQAPSHYWCGLLGRLEIFDWRIFNRLWYNATNQTHEIPSQSRRAHGVFGEGRRYVNDRNLQAIPPQYVLSTEFVWNQAQIDINNGKYNPLSLRKRSVFPIFQFWWQFEQQILQSPIFEYFTALFYRPKKPERQNPTPPVKRPTKFTPLHFSLGPWW